MQGGRGIEGSWGFKGGRLLHARGSLWASLENINESVLDELVVTNSIPLRPEAKRCKKIRQLSVAEMLAETIRRMAAGESVSSMYVD